MADVQWIHGETRPRTFQLTANGSALSLVGATVALVLTTPEGREVATSGDVTITGESTGMVQYAPDAADLNSADSPLLARWRITDSSGFIAYAPGGDPDQWTIRPVGR